MTRDEDFVQSVMESVQEAGPLLYALCGVADERGLTLTLQRSPRGALVISVGEPPSYLTEDSDETEALRRAHALLERTDNPDIIAEIPKSESPQVPNGASESSSSSTLTALQGALSDLIAKWRATATVSRQKGRQLGNPDDVQVVELLCQEREFCADDLEALAVVRVPQRQEEKDDDDLARRDRLPLADRQPTQPPTGEK